MPSSASSPDSSASLDHYSGFVLGDGVGRSLSVSDALAAIVARIGPRRRAGNITVNGEPWDGSDLDPLDYPDAGYYGDADAGTDDRDGDDR